MTPPELITLTAFGVSLLIWLSLQGENRMTATATEKPLDGWTEWEGDAQCPTGVDCFVEVELRDGTTCEGRSDSFRWRHLTSSRSMRDIVAYRVVPADQPRGDAANQPEDGGVQASLQYRTLGANETIREGDEKRTNKGWELSDAWKGSPYVRNPALHYRRPIEYGVWFDWQGGECPVDLATVIDVRLASGDEDSGKATSFYWNHDGDGADIVAYRVVSADQPAEPKKQPQPGEWWEWQWIGDRRPVMWCSGRTPDGELTWQKKKDGSISRQAMWVGSPIRHLPDCTGFDYVPPPEETPAEKRLGEMGIALFDGHYDNDSDAIEAARWTPDQLEAIAAHMREREGGAE